MSAASVDVELQGIAAPPMANGEVVFEAPWQGRVFGMARALCEAGHYSWDEFRECLIDAIGDWDREAEGDYRYFDHFLLALETLLERKNLLSAGELSERFGAYQARPHDHDH
ncbi:MAG: nitrile hydratase accessory protein [Gammaproteobacteria bacterium]|nr:nitrile hydratase accessory protein [Gammaproteobacteria bacterium]